VVLYIHEAFDENLHSDAVSFSDKNHHLRQSNNVMKILDTPLQISSLEEQQKITERERPLPAWFSAEKKITTVMSLYD